MNKDNVKLAIAPIGWTNDDMPELGSENTFQQIVSEMALAGFTGSEVGSKYPRDPAVLKPMLDIRGIQICNAWFSTFFANGQREKTIDEFVNHMNFLHAMGAKVIGCSEQSGSIQGLDKPILGDAKPCFSDEEWQRVAEGYNTLGRLAAEDGQRAVQHLEQRGGRVLQLPAAVLGGRVADFLDSVRDSWVAHQLGGGAAYRVVVHALAVVGRAVRVLLLGAGLGHLAGERFLLRRERLVLLGHLRPPSLISRPIWSQACRRARKRPPRRTALYLFPYSVVPSTPPWP